MKKIKLSIPILLTMIIISLGFAFFIFLFTVIIKKGNTLGNRIVLKDSKKNYGFNLSYYNYSKDGRGLFGSTKQENTKGYNDLAKAIVTHMYHGPEISELNEIVFGDDNVVSENENGLYIPATKQIFINIDAFKNLKNPKEKETGIINGLLGIVVHEYGHHIMNIYANSYTPTDKSKFSKNIDFKNNGNWIKEPWNSQFYNSFTKDLNYEHSTYSKYDKQFGSITNKKKKILSIGNYASASQLFDFANNKQSKFNLRNSNFFVNSIYNNKGKKLDSNLFLNDLSPKSAFIPSDSIKKNNIQYVYSMDELATRQLSQLMYSYPVKTNSSYWGRLVPSKQPNSFILESFVSDLIRSRIPTYNIQNFELLSRKDDSTNIIYMSDTPWGGAKIIGNTKPTIVFENQAPTNNDLYKAYSNLIGITSKNNSSSSINEIYAFNDLKIYDHINHIPWKSSFLNKIKISGFNKGNHVGLWVNNKQYFFDKLALNKNHTFLNKKNSVLDFKKNINVPNKNDYILKDFIDVSDLHMYNTNNQKNNKWQIYWLDKNSTGHYIHTPMSPSSIDLENHLYSTYRSFMRSTNNNYDQITYISSDTKGVYLTKGGYFANKKSQPSSTRADY